MRRRGGQFRRHGWVVFDSLWPHALEPFEHELGPFIDFEALAFGTFGVVLPVRDEPPAQRKVAFAGIEGELIVDLVEVPPLDARGAHDGARRAFTIEYDEVFTDLRQRLE